MDGIWTEKTTGKRERTYSAYYTYASGAPNYYSYVRGDTFSTIRYTKYPRGKSSNRCLHIKQTATPLWPSNYKWGDSAQNTYEWHGIEVDPIFDVRNIREFPAGFVGRAFAAMSPTLQGPFSAPDALRELLEFKQTFVGLFSLARRLKSLIEVGGIAVKNRRPKDSKDFYDSLRNIFANIPSDFLLYTFGVNAFVNDMGKLYSALAEFSVRLSVFRRQAGALLSAHYKESSDETSDINPDLYGSLNSLFIVSKNTTFGKTSFHASMKYSYEIIYPEFDIPTIFKRYLGFRNSPHLLWNAIPFSFVVDWFLRVGDALKTLDESVIPVRLTIHDFCISRKQHNKCYCTGQYRHNYAVMEPKGVVPWSRSTFQFYERTWVEPQVAASAIVLPRLDGISVNELVLAIALLIS